MSIRNYNAFLKAARRASKQTGGLSLPAARKVYTKMAARLGRPLKGTDVKKHPRIFSQSEKSAKPKPRPTPIHKPVPVKRTAPARRTVAPVREVRFSQPEYELDERAAISGGEIDSIEDYEAAWEDDWFLDEGEDEYVSSASYEKKE